MTPRAPSVLQVNKFLWEFGGPERVMLELTDVLRARGADVEFFAMKHERNLPSDNADFFVEHADYRSGSIGIRGALRAARQTIYSKESKEKMAALLAEKGYDLAHVHLIEHHISPSILDALSEHEVPIVHTCHDHKLVCPESHLYSQPAGEVCERCVDSGSYYHVALRRCMRGSVAVSTLAAAAQYVHRSSRIYERNVAVFIAPSSFLAERLVRGGIPSDKVKVIPNGVDLRRFEPSYVDDGYALYFGRISVEKGLPTLVDAMRRIPEVPLKIVGDGPTRRALEERVDELGLSNVTFLGRLQGPALLDVIGRARLTVLSSTCHENCPMAVLESFAMGKPVVGTRVGGVPELVFPGETGSLVESGDAEALALHIAELFHDPDRCRTMGVAARAHVESTSRAFVDRTLDVYRELGVALPAPAPLRERGSGYAL